jgi:hypothetical protein
VTLTVEDGTGFTTANAFVSLADCDQYHLDRGNTSWIGTDEDKEAAIIRATSYLSRTPHWSGYRVKGRDQALAWPRYDVMDGQWSVAPDSVPVEVIHATCEVALRELTTPGTLNPDVTRTQIVKKEKIGPIETEYTTGSTRAVDSRPVLTIVDDLIRGLITSDGRSVAIFGEVSRL